MSEAKPMIRGADLEDVIYFLHSIANSFPGFKLDLNEFRVNNQDMNVIGIYQGKPMEVFVNFNERSWTAFCEGEVIKDGK